MTRSRVATVPAVVWRTRPSGVPAMAVTSAPVRISPPRRPDCVREGQREAPPVDDPGAGDVKPAQAANLRLDLAHLVRSKLAERDPVGARPLGDRGQAGELVLLGRHDQLTADLVGDAVLVGEGEGRAHALGAEASLERSRGVGVRRVDHAAVAPGLVRREALLLLQDDQPQAGARLQQPVRGGKADDPAADDDEVGAIGHATAVAGSIRPVMRRFRAIRYRSGRPQAPRRSRGRTSFPKTSTNSAWLRPTLWTWTSSKPMST